MERYDAIIIGFGKGGKTLAGKLAGSKKRVALIEKSEAMYGGTCINVGCIPSKSLIHSALESCKNKEDTFYEKARRYQAAVEEKRNLTAMLRKKNFDKLNDMENVTIYNGTGTFLSSTVVRVEGKGQMTELEGERIFINTGSTPVIPNIPGLRDNPYVYTSEGLMDLTELPRQLIIIGGGYIGLEFASMYADFGSKVTVLVDTKEFLGREDKDVAAEIKKVLEQKGIQFYLGARITEVGRTQEEAYVLFEQEKKAYQISGQAILTATGRRPNTDSLNVQAAGVALTERGAVIVDDNLKTTAPNIWAMGDVTGGFQFTYVSLDDSRIIWSGMNGGTYTAKDRTNIPYSVFINPSYSRVGLNEKEAAEKGCHVLIKKLPAAAIPKAWVLKDTQGLLKAVIDADTNQILGAMLFCEESYEIINIIKLAMDLKADYHMLENQIFTHPTMSEAFNDLF